KRTRWSRRRSLSIRNRPTRSRSRASSPPEGDRRPSCRVAWCCPVAEITIFHGGTIVALDAPGTVRRADLLVEAGVIREIGGPFETPGAARVDCTGALVLPGFVQAHVHLSQALFRGLAEEADLLQWLERKIWPLEAAHTADSLRASARLGLAEMIR